jgi:hypothetical protein
MANEPSYLETIAQMRQERAQRERVERSQEIRDWYTEAQRNRDEAAARGDVDSFEMHDDDCQRLEQDWQQLNPPQPPQLDPRLVDFAKRNSQFLERYGQRAFQALDAAHQYMVRPRNPRTNDPRYTGMGMGNKVFTPQYFDKLKDLLEMHGEKFLGVRFDRSEESLTPNEAAKISGLSPRAYNNALRVVASQGRLGTDRK